MNVKIFITYKDRHQLIKSDILTPIQTGRAIAQSTFEEMIGDDTGENISSRNENFNELTAQYWAWKNYDKIGNPDYIGFMHYRRHFIFNNKKYRPSFLGTVRFDKIDDSYIKEISLNDRDICSFIGDSDLVCIKRLDLLERAKILKCPQCATPKGAYWYNRGLKVKDYDLMLKVLAELSPEYARSAYVYTKGHISFGYNCFIMKKDLFLEYNEFLFPILFELEKRIDFTSYCDQGLRTLGYLGERLLSIFILKKLNDKKRKIKETPLSIVTHTEETPEPMAPAWDKQCIVFSSSDCYAPYTTVAISSLITNHRSGKKLDIVILTEDMSEKNKKKILELFSDDSISIRFYNMGSHILPKGVKTSSTISRVTYYRLFIPQIFKSYDKVLFLDSDIVILRDIEELLSIDLSGARVGMAVDATMRCFLLDNFHKDSNYIRNELGIENPHEYYNAGVMLFNMREFWEHDATGILSLLEGRKYTYFDQDVINMYFRGSIKEIPLKWNFTTSTLVDEIYKFIPVDFAKKFMQAKEDCCIIHYNSSYKPWVYPDRAMSEIWWKYARLLPYYHEIIAKLVDSKSSEQTLRAELAGIHFPRINQHFAREDRNLKLLFVLQHPVKFKFMKWRYGIKKVLSYGKRRKEYQRRYDLLKSLVKEARAYGESLSVCE